MFWARLALPGYSKLKCWWGLQGRNCRIVMSCLCLGCHARRTTKVQICRAIFSCEHVRSLCTSPWEVLATLHHDHWYHWCSCGNAVIFPQYFAGILVRVWAGTARPRSFGITWLYAVGDSYFPIQSLFTSPTHRIAGSSHLPLLAQKVATRDATSMTHQPSSFRQNAPVSLCSVVITLKDICSKYSTKITFCLETNCITKIPR